MFEPFPSLSLTAPAPPERSPLEPDGDYERRVGKWRRDNAKWQGQVNALQHLDPPPTTQIPRIPYLSESEQ